ncbi:MAG: YbgA family protein [Spongiibacteraceae bacterium]
MRDESADLLRVRDEWQALQREGVTVAALQAFYSRYKYLVMSRHLASYKAIGTLLAQAEARNLAATAQQFFELLLNALSMPATRGGNVNALLHISGYLKQQLSADERRLLRECIERYGRGEVELADPIALLRLHFQRFPHRYIEQQVFLQTR